MSKRWEWKPVGGLADGRVYIRSGDESHPGWCVSEGDLSELMRELEPRALAAPRGSSPAGVVRHLGRRAGELASRVGLLEGRVHRGGDAEAAAEALRARVAELEADLAKLRKCNDTQSETIVAYRRRVDEAAQAAGMAEERAARLKEHAEGLRAALVASQAEVDEAAEREDQLHVDLADARRQAAELEGHLGSERGELLMIVGDLYRKARRVHHADGSHVILGDESEVVRFRVEAAGEPEAAEKV